MGKWANELKEIIITVFSINSDEKEKYLFLFWTVIIIATLSAIQTSLSRKRSNRQRKNNRTRHHEQPTPNQYIGKRNKRKDDREINSTREESEVLMKSILESRAEMDKSRKKTRQQLLNEYKELSTLQIQLQKDLKDLKGVLSSLQTMQQQR